MSCPCRQGNESQSIIAHLSVAAYNVNDLVLRLLLEVLGEHRVEVLTASCQVSTVDIERLALHHQLRVTHERLLPQSLKPLDYCNAMLAGLVAPPVLACRCC